MDASHRCTFRLYALISLSLVLLTTQAPEATAARLPGQGDWFEYEVVAKVDGRTGVYDEYSDQLDATGKYQIKMINETHGRVRARYSWDYSDNEGESESGREDRTVDWVLETRRYDYPYTDLDDYDGLEPREMCIWFWIPTGLDKGDTLQILDDTYKVRDTDATLWSDWEPRRLIKMVAKGTGYRDDDYGQFSYTYTDELYYDRDTGMVVAERYREHDDGRWEGQVGTFDYNYDLDVTSASYDIELDYWAIAEIAFDVFLIVGSFALLIYFVRWRTHKYTVRGVTGQVRMFRVRRMDRYPRLKNEATTHFAPFLEDFVRKSLLARDRVAVAVSGDRLVGFAFYNREAKIATIFSPDMEVNDKLRGYVGTKDFFSEVRHRIPDHLVDLARREGTVISNTNAYNVFETYQILRLEYIPDIQYDTDLVRAMEKKDLRAVGALAKKVYKVRSTRWLRAQFLSGDIGFVAESGGAIVGFAFATYSNGYGRVHTLTVHPDHRNRGIGKELMRARLRALRDLGTEWVVTEIADWNLASLQIARRNGFTPAGTMYVETSRTKRIKKTIMRR